MPYKHYTVSDFVLDESFLAYVLCTDPEAVAFWTNWLASHPEKEKEIKEATEIIRLLNGPKKTLIAPGKEAELRRLIEQLPPNREPFQPKPSYRSLLLFRYRHFPGSLAAAVLAFVILAGVGWYVANRYLPTNQIEIRTGYGEKRKIFLPDGSQVILNANTTLRYQPDWESESNREVWLAGEAFFQIRKRLSAGKPVKFTVRAGDLGVEVIGTQFDVLNRSAHTRVVLEEGKVRLHSNETSKPLLEMAPGEAVVFSQQDHLITRQRVNPDLYNSWRINRLVFDNTPLTEVAETIRYAYGKTVTFSDPELMNRRLTGTIPDDDLQRLIQALSRAFDLRITLREDEILIQSR